MYKNNTNNFCKFIYVGVAHIYEILMDLTLILPILFDIKVSLALLCLDQV